MNPAEVAKACREAAEALDQPGHPHMAASPATAGAAALPIWLLNILKVVGPAVLQAVQAWIQKDLAANPTPRA